MFVISGISGRALFMEHHRFKVSGVSRALYGRYFGHKSIYQACPPLFSFTFAYPANVFHCCCRSVALMIEYCKATSFFSLHRGWATGLHVVGAVNSKPREGTGPSELIIPPAPVLPPVLHHCTPCPAPPPTPPNQHTHTHLPSCLHLPSFFYLQLQFPLQGWLCFQSGEVSETHSLTTWALWSFSSTCRAVLLPIFMPDTTSLGVKNGRSRPPLTQHVAWRAVCFCDKIPSVSCFIDFNASTRQNCLHAQHWSLPQ